MSAANRSRSVRWDVVKLALRQHKWRLALTVAVMPEGWHIALHDAANTKHEREAGS